MSSTAVVSFNALKSFFFFFFLQVNEQPWNLPRLWVKGFFFFHDMGNWVLNVIWGREV